MNRLPNISRFLARGNGRVPRSPFGRACHALADEAGVALVEFALVSVVFMLVLFGVTQFGLALNSANDETHLANELARYAAVNYNPAPSGQSLAAWVKSQGDNTFVSGSGKVCISFPNGSSNIGDPVRVDVQTTFDWQPVYGFSQLLGGGIPASSTVSGSAVMRLEAAPTVYSAGCT
jgi:hypothetical protein